MQSLSLFPVLIGLAPVLCSDVHDHPGHDDGRRERWHREPDRVVGEDDHLWPRVHDWADGWYSASLPLDSLLLIRPPPQVIPAIIASVQTSTTRHPMSHSDAGMSGLRSR